LLSVTLGEVVSMGRHGPRADADVAPVTPAALPLPARLALIAAGCVVLLGAVVLLAPPDAMGRLPWAAEGTCPAETVHLLIEPELRSTVSQSLAAVEGRRVAGGRCVAVDITPQEAVETVATAEGLPKERVPEIWVPDSSVWVDRMRAWKTTESKGFATSAVVLATSRAAAVNLGLSTGNPTWSEVMRGTRAVAVPDIQSEAESLAAMVALWQTLGKGSPADQAVVNIVLAADRGEVPTAEEALTLARSGSVNAPIVPTTEQAVAALNQSSPEPDLAAIYPREGSPLLTYPVTRVTSGTETAAKREAVQLVLDRLGSAETQAIAKRNGFRGANASPATGEGIATRQVTLLPPPDTQEVQAMLERLNKLAQPSRILALLDVSLSMRNTLDDGLRRIDVGALAVRLGADVLPDSSSAGAWIFAHRLQGNQDWRQVTAIRPLGSVSTGGATYRGEIGRLTSNPDQYLAGGGTGLYDTLIAAVRHMHQTYDERADNVVLVITDGANEDPGSPTLAQATAEIRRLNAGPRKVRMFFAGLGPDADYDAIAQLAAASNGGWYRIDNALQGQSALLDGIRRARGITK
jgi:Ca-activated chloride channel family protein